MKVHGVFFKLGGGSFKDIFSIKKDEFFRNESYKIECPMCDVNHLTELCAKLSTCFSHALRRDFINQQ